ncbi:penicillin acylase family protein, partial [Salmonella sp. SAL4449]|uniref:penicillin acylase family protein n=1 Tax=Salmonella sp. SAL4449 TaxID=3159904 RepID=UPI003979F49F
THLIATANHNILPPGYAHEVSYEWAPPYRYLRIKHVLDAKKKFSLDDFQRIQHDNTSLPGQVLVWLLKGAKLDTRAMQSEAVRL